MSDGWSITITPVSGGEDCKIRTSDGQEFVVKGLALFADSGGEGNLFSFYWNSPKVAACALVRSCVESIRREDPFALKFYQTMFYMFAKATGAQNTVLTPEDAVRMFEAKEVYEAMKDPAKFN
jgi:hypothetical protein